jgi:glutathione S-transferase
MHEKNSEIEVEVGFNMGLPMLEDADLKIHDAIAIMMYICRKYESHALIGLTPQVIVNLM